MSFCPFFSNGFTPLLSKTQVIKMETYNFFLKIECTFSLKSFFTKNHPQKTSTYKQITQK